MKWASTPLYASSLRKDHDGTLFDVAFSPDSRSYVCSSFGGRIGIAPVGGSTPLLFLQGPDLCRNWGVSVAWHANRIITGHADGTMKIWDATTRALLTSIRAHDQWTSITISPTSSHWIVSGGGDVTQRSAIEVWTPAGQHVRTLVNNTVYLGCLRFSPDGQLLASGHGDATVQVRDFTTGAMRFSLHGHTSAIHSVAFSDDGTQLASGADDRRICVWMLSDGTLKTTLSGHTRVVEFVGFIGNILLSGSEDGFVKVWRDGRAIQSLSMERPIRTMCVSPDKRKVAVGDDDGIVVTCDAFSYARDARTHAVMLLLIHLRGVDEIRGYEMDYVRHHVLPELPWQAWL